MKQLWSASGGTITIKVGDTAIGRVNFISPGDWDMDHPGEDPNQAGWYGYLFGREKNEEGRPSLAPDGGLFPTWEAAASGLVEDYHPALEWDKIKVRVAKQADADMAIVKDIGWLSKNLRWLITPEYVRVGVGRRDYKWRLLDLATTHYWVRDTRREAEDLAAEEDTDWKHQA